MKTTSIFSAFVIVTAFGLAGAASVQAQASFVPYNSSRAVAGTPMVVSDAGTPATVQATHEEQVATLIHQYKVAIKEADRLIKLATTDEERDALKAKKAELQHAMITLQQSNG